MKLVRATNKPVNEYTNEQRRPGCINSIDLLTERYAKMSMEEKYGAIWIAVKEDGSAQLVFEQYYPDITKLQVIYQQSNGCFLPYSFVPKKDRQWTLPVWSQENEKAMMPTIGSAKEYLSHFLA